MDENILCVSCRIMNWNFDRKEYELDFELEELNKNNIHLQQNLCNTCHVNDIKDTTEICVQSSRENKNN